MRKRSKILPRTDAPSLGKFVTRLVTGNPITEDISPIARGGSGKDVPPPDPFAAMSPRRPKRHPRKKAR